MLEKKREKNNKIKITNGCDETSDASCQVYG